MGGNEKQIFIGVQFFIDLYRTILLSPIERSPFFMQSCYGLVITFMDFETPAIMRTWKVSFPDIKKKSQQSDQMAVKFSQQKSYYTEGERTRGMKDTHLLSFNFDLWIRVRHSVNQQKKGGRAGLFMLLG